MTRSFIFMFVALPSLALAEPALEEFSGGAVSDEVRAAMRDALYEELPLLGESALAPRPAGVAKLRMDAVAQKYPREAVVQKYLGRVCYTTGDVSCAEKAYKAAIDLAPGQAWPLAELADFYAARNQPKDELAAIDRWADALKPGAVGARGTTDGRNALRAALERGRDVAVAHALDSVKYERAIVDLYPDDPSYLRRFVDGLVAAGKPAAALAEVARYRKTFPAEVRYFAQVESSIAEAKRDADKAEAVYRNIFARAPMPARDADGLYDDYLDLLKRQAHEREVKRALSAKARTGKLGGGELALLVHLHLHAGDRDQAKKLLDEAAKTPGTATELLLRARLYGSVGAPAEAVPILYAAYRKAVVPAEKQQALGELGLALLQGDAGRTGLTPLGPLDGFRLRHVASGPSVAGGLASLLWNGVHGSSADDLDRVEAAYGNGARAGAVLAELKKIAPRARQTALLTRALVEFRRGYRDDADAVRLADEYTRAFPKEKEWFEVARDGCDSRWRGHIGDAPACYVRLLDEATRRGDGREYEATLRALTSAYERDKKQVEIVRLYWSEIGKRPWDAALYERFLEHLSRHNLYDEELKVYQEGVKRFATSAWYDRLARWHLRHKGQAAFRALTEKLLTTVDDDLANEYLQSQVSYRWDDTSSQVFYEAMYRHALDRFPLDERFAKQLISFYDRDRRDPARALALVKRYAFFDEGLRARLLREQAADGVLERTVASLGRGKNVVERQLAASALTFLSRQEEAEPVLAALCNDFPGDRPLARRHAALVRALARPSLRAASQQASTLIDGLTKLFPADESLVTEAGDYLSEAGLFDEAAKKYERIVQIRPGDPEAYLRLASIYWDYFHFDQAAEAIQRARKRAADPLKFADKLAAVYESRKDYPQAIAEYVRLIVGAQKLESGSRFVPTDDERRAEYGDGADEEGGGWRDPGAAADPGSGAAIDRLVYLAHKKSLGGAIDKAFRAQVQTGDGRAVLGYAAYLASMGDDEGRRKLLVAEAGKTTDPRLLERIAADARGNAEEKPVLVAALAREAALGKGAPSYVYPLVDALTDDKRDADAERELKQLIDRLDAGGEDDREEDVQARVAYADFLWARKRADEAIAARDGAAAKATGQRQIDLQLDAIGWRTERGRLDEAAQRARALVDAHPGEPRFVGPLAAALWKKGDRDGVFALYAAQIKAVKATAFSDDQKRSMTAELRHAFAGRLDEAGRAREAVDQYMEIVDRQPTNAAEVQAMHHYAAAHGLLKKVTDFFGKQAKTSNKDWRWPVVMATIADLEGDPRGAAEWLGAALQVSPDRVDLHTQRAEAYARGGDPAQAAAVYHHLWEMQDHDPKWAIAEATMLARAGKRAEALAAAKRLVESDPPDPSAWWRAAEVLEKAGLVEDAWPLAAKAIEKGRKDLHGQSLDRAAAQGYARLAARTGHSVEAWRALDKLYDVAHAEAAVEGNPEPWRAGSTADAARDASDDALPKAVAEYASDDEARRFAGEVRKIGGPDAIERGARVALAAGRPDVARALYRQAAAGNDPNRRFHNLLVGQLQDADQWDEVIALLRGTGDEHDLLALARACRALGDPCEEEALARHADHMPTYGQPEQWRFGEPDRDLERYLEILVAKKREPRLRELAERGTLHAGQIADFLFAHGRADLGQIAVASAGRSEAPVWRNAKQASALLALGGRGAQARDLLASILYGQPAPRPIGQQIGRHPDEREEVVSRRWFRYAERFGDALAQAGQRDDARRFAAAPVEDKPLDAAAYVAHGDALERQGDHARAEAAYERALVLRSADARAIDHLAKAYLAAGDRKHALATWDRVVAGKRPTEAMYRSRFDLVRAAGLVDEARRVYGDHLRAGFPKRPSPEAIADLRALGAAYPSHAAGSEWEKFLRGLLDQSGWKDLPLLAAMSGRAGEPLLDGPAREPYLRMGMQRAPEEERAAWRQALAEWGLVERHFDATLDAVAEERKATGEQAGFWTVIDRAKARGGKGDVAAAAQELVASLAGRGDGDKLAAAAVLADLRSPAEWEVRRDVYRGKVAVEGHGAADEIGLADALLHLGQKDEAVTILKRLPLKRLDDEEAWRLAAEEAEKSSLWPLARDLRRGLVAVRPRDGAARLALARDEKEAGDPAAAVKVAGALVIDRAAEAEARRGAAALLGDWQRARVSGAQAALDALAQAGADEALAIGRAHAADAAQPIVDALPQLAAPRSALAEASERAMKRGRPADAAPLLRKLRALGVADEGTRRSQLQAELAARRPGAALEALDDEAAERYAQTVTNGQADLGAGGDRVLAAEVDHAAAALRRLPGDEGPRLARTAADAAEQANDRGRLAFYAAVVDALAPSPAAHARAAAARGRADELRRIRARRFVTASIDDLSVAPAAAANPVGAPK